MTRLSNKSDGGFGRVGLAIMPNSGVRQCFCESRSRCGGNLTGRNRDENLRYDELGISSCYVQGGVGLLIPKGGWGPGDLDVHFFCNHIDTKYSNITCFKYHSVVFHSPKNYSMTLITIEGSKVIEEIERCMPLTTMPARYLGGN